MGSFSTGYTWVYGLVSAAGVGILYIVFNQVFYGHLVPVIKDMVNESATIPNVTKHIVYANIDKYIYFFNIMPFVIFFGIVIYMISAAIRRERESEYE